MHIMRSLVILCLFGITLASYYKPKTKKCYQCSYTPSRTHVDTIKVPRVVYNIVKTPKVVSETVSRTVVDQQTMPVTRTEVFYVTKSKVEFDVTKVPQQVTRLVKTPKIVKDVHHVTRIHKYPVHVTRLESVPVTRTMAEKVPVASYDSYAPPTYDWKVVSYQDMEKRVVQDTIFETKLVSDPVVQTRKAFDESVETDTIYVTKQVSKLKTEQQPRQKVVTDYVTSPVSRVVHETVTRQDYVTSKVSSQVFDEKTIKRHLQGGWDKCKGAFDAWQAKKFGIDEWECHDNCYIRTDSNGNISRGCYKGEYEVDPNKIGCHYQGGSTYCFCEGNLCNNGDSVASTAGASAY